MRTLVLVGVATVSLLAPALAADLEQPAPAPVYKAPLAPAPYYDWTGFYIGGFGSVTWANTHTTVLNTATDTPFAPFHDSVTAGHGGGQFGVDYMTDAHVLFGIVGDAASADTHSTTVGDATGSSTMTTRGFVSGTVRARIGYAMDRVLLYGTGGYAWWDGAVSRTQVTGMAGAAGPGTVESMDTELNGWTAGAGLAFAFAREWNVFAEYRFTSMGSGYTFPVSQRSTNSLIQTNTFEIGLNFKLDANPAGCPWYQRSC